MTSLKKIWKLACLDLRLWGRRPLLVASALLPPLGMALLLVVLSLTVTREPVALVVQSRGPNTQRMEQLIESDTDAYSLTVTDAAHAAHMLAGQETAAIIVIPPGFEQDVPRHAARLSLQLNNVDIDFADDIRRSADRSVGAFDALPLNLDYDEDPKHPDHDSPPQLVVPPGAVSINPYHITIAEHDLRKTRVDFLHYQVLPVLILLILNVGLMGTALLCAGDVERGTARLLRCAPLAAWVVPAGRLVGGVLACGVVLIPAVLICVGTGIMSPPPDHWLAVIALFACTAACASGLGAALGVLLRGSGNIALASSVLATYLFFLGGGFTTIAFLPDWLRVVSAFDPMRYAIDGLRQSLFYPDLTGFGLDLAALLGTAALSVAAGTVVMRWVDAESTLP